MKKLISLMLVISFAVTLFACGSENTAQSNEKPDILDISMPDSPNSGNSENSVNSENSENNHNSDEDYEDTTDHLYVFEICEGEFSQDKLINTIKEFQNHGTPFSVKKGEDISFEINAEVSNVIVQGVARVEGNDINAELDGGIYLLVYSDYVYAADSGKTVVTADAEWWYDSNDRTKDNNLWSYVIHTAFADGTEHYFYLRAEFEKESESNAESSVSNENGAAAFSGNITFRSARSSDLSLTAVSGDNADFILTLLNQGEWSEGTCDCISDYVINIGDISLRYHAECGTFNDSKNCRSLTVENGTRALIRLNSILGYKEEYSGDYLYAPEIEYEEFTDEVLAEHIAKYADANKTNSRSQGETAAIDAGFEVKSASIPCISRVDENGDVKSEMQSVIDLYIAPQIIGNTVLIPTDWWYDDGSWVQNYPVWSYLVRVTDTEGKVHYFYTRIEHI